MKQGSFSSLLIVFSFFTSFFLLFFLSQFHDCLYSFLFYKPSSPHLLDFSFFHFSCHQSLTECLLYGSQEEDPNRGNNVCTTLWGAGGEEHVQCEGTKEKPT